MSQDAAILRAFIGAALSRGVPGYRADYLLDCLRRLEGPKGREGIVTVYDSLTDEYLGCMGKHTWERLLDESRRDYATARWNDVAAAFVEASTDEETPR